MSKEFSIIVAIDEENGIGRDGDLPWRLPEDLKYFSRVTKKAAKGKQNAVIMGRVTWESLPPAHQPLDERVNMVLTSQSDYILPDNVEKFSSMTKALEWARKSRKIDKIFVIGGGRVFEEAVFHKDCEKMYITTIYDEFDCDTFFPEIDESVFEIESAEECLEEGGVEYQFFVYKRK